MNVREELIGAAERYGERTCFYYQDQVVTFRNLREHSFRLAAALSGIGVRKGDRVAIYLPNCPEYVVAYLAVYSLGALAVPLDFLLSEEEVAAFLNHSGAAVLVSTRKARLELRSLPPRAPSLRQIIVVEKGEKGFLDFWALVGSSPASPPTVPIGESDLSSIFYTSGSTGKPKGALWNCRHLHLGAQWAHERIGIDHTFRSIAAIPFSHSAGILFPALALRYGMEFVIMERFSPAEFLRLIEEHRVNNIWLVPSMFYALLTLKQIEHFDLSSLRWVDFFGAPSDPEVIAQFKRYCPRARLTNGWGMTETAPPTTVSDPDEVGSVGRVFPKAEVKIVGPDDREQPAGKAGEVVVRGEVVCLGYYREPELTAQVFRNGWLHTGDLGRFDEKGNLYIVGRIKDMIKVAGEIVVASEIELVLLKHPCVVEAAAIGVADKIRGQVPKAFVVLEEGVTLPREHLIRYLKKYLAGFKVPRAIEFRSSLPKTGPGKVDKAKLLKETSAASSPVAQ